MADSFSFSRPTSVSRARRPISAHSRSLIRKKIQSQDLNAADLLIERFSAWKTIVKQLASYFEGIADIENSSAREMTRIAAIIQVPFRSGNQFLGEGGLQVRPCNILLFPLLPPFRMFSTVSATRQGRWPISMQILVALSTAPSFSTSKNSLSRSRPTSRSVLSSLLSPIQLNYP